MFAQIDQTADTTSPQRIPRKHTRKHIRRRRRVIRLRPGQSAVRSCSRFPTRTVVQLIREGEALVVVCRGSRRRFVFVCGVPKKVKFVVISRRTKIVVHCVR